ncbi:Protein bicaudal C homolog 1 [Linum perenne]
MADMQPPELHLLGTGAVGGPGVAPLIPAGASNQVTSSETVGSKRQRRPSVRLGDIGGDSLYDPYSRKAITTSASSKHWKQQISTVDHKRDSTKASKTRALTNLTSGEYNETLDENKELNLEKVAIGSWRVKETKKRAPISTVKRVRSNWVTKVEEGDGNNNAEGDDEKYSAGGGGEDMEDFDAENSDTPSKEESPIHSHENLGDGNERNEYYNRRNTTRSRSGNHHHNSMSNHHHNHNHQDGVELLSVPSETDTRGGGGYRENDMCVAGVDGVRIWLDNLGLGRYAPVFEIHEVDDEVLPMLTLEDLKDMGINAVGSRRKMFAAIQKLNKGFS